MSAPPHTHTHIRTRLLMHRFVCESQSVTIRRMFVPSDNTPRITELQGRARAPNVIRYMSWSLSSFCHASHSCHCWPIMTTHNLGLSDFYNHLTRFWEPSRVDSIRLIGKVTQVIYQIMRGNACDLTFTYYCSLWGFWREVIASSLLQRATGVCFVTAAIVVSSSELSMGLSYLLPNGSSFFEVFHEDHLLMSKSHTWTRGLQY